MVLKSYAKINLTLIDYEYCMYNFRAYDIANHFNEYAGFDGDYSRWFPSEEQQIKFINWYLYASKDVEEHEEGSSKIPRIENEEDIYIVNFFVRCRITVCTI